MKKVLIINGPNINFTGKREPGIYGDISYEKICDDLMMYAKKHNTELEIFQSNHEGEIIDRIQQSHGVYDLLVLNPGAYTHYSYAIRDAIKSTMVKTIEVHMSNVHSREEFRRISVTAPVCSGQISGFGADGYKMAIIAGLGMI